MIVGTWIWLVFTILKVCIRVYVLVKHSNVCFYLCTPFRWSYSIGLLLLQLEF